MWPVFVSSRYLFARRKEKFISIISLISILGVAVGVAALIVVISIMTGFDEEIKEKIIGTYAHIVITSSDGIVAPADLAKDVLTDKNIVAWSPFIDRQAVIKSGGKMLGVIVRGIDPEREPQTTSMARFTGKGKLDFGDDGIIMGSELMRSLNLHPGDNVALLSPQTGKTTRYTIVDSFTSGRYDYDANIICMNIAQAMGFFDTQKVTGIGVKVRDEFDLLQTKRALQEKLGYPFFVRSWMDIDKNLMKALAMEKKMMFIVLGLIVIVACFNISGSLIMMVMEKTKDIGILRSIGARATDVGFIFLLNGLFTGILGTGLGALAGISIASNINAISDVIEKVTGFEFFPNDIYYFSVIPSRVDMHDVTVIVLFAVCLAMVSGIYPAIQAARMDPVRAIRYE